MGKENREQNITAKKKLIFEEELTQVVMDSFLLEHPGASERAVRLLVELRRKQANKGQER